MTTSSEYFLTETEGLPGAPLTDTANARVFTIGLRGARMKRVGGDSGHYEREEFVEGVIVAPSERVVVDVLLDEPGELTVEHQNARPDLPVGDDHRHRRAG